MRLILTAILASLATAAAAQDAAEEFAIDELEAGLDGFEAPADAAMAAIDDDDDDDNDWEYIEGRSIDQLVAGGFNRIFYYGSEEEFPHLTAFETVLEQSFEEDLSIAEAAAAIAPQFATEPSTMEHFVRSLLAFSIFEYRERERRPAATTLVEAASMLGDKALGREAATAFIAESDGFGQCDAALFAQYIQAFPPDAAQALRMVEDLNCQSALETALLNFPELRLRLLVERFDYYGLNPDQYMAAIDWLLAPEQLSRIGGIDKARLIGKWSLIWLRSALQIGEKDRARTFYRSLSPAQQMAMFDKSPNKLHYTVDGRDVEEDFYGETAAYADIVTTFAAMGERQIANEIADHLCGDTRDAFWLSRDSQAREGCSYGRHNRADGLLLAEYVLRSSDEDPYFLAEIFRGDFGTYVPSYAGASETVCRVLAEPAYAALCQHSLRSAAGKLRRYNEDDKPEIDRQLALFARYFPNLMGSYPTYKAAADAELERIEQQLGESDSDQAPRTTILADPPPFAVTRLADSSTALDEEELERPDVGQNFPAGYFPFRAEKTGDQWTVISLSQRFDPVGEIGMGGYWVHLSDDGGNSWHNPIYTGLVEAFPFVVRRASTYPLRVGDTLYLHVDLEELDTASITYPPVGIRSRRSESNLMLTIPLADLQADRDQDGLSDIAERNLLLDRADIQPFIVGSDHGECDAPDPLGNLRLQILAGLGNFANNAIIEPINRAPGDLSISQWRRIATTDNPPILINGDPTDYRCLSPDRLMIVYDDQQVEAMQRYRPDFRAIALPQIVFNRAGTRGFVVWSAGWTGGTYRLIKQANGSWHVQSISEWVT